LSPKDKNAAVVASFVRQALDKKTTVAPFSVDDRYLIQNSYCYLQAFADARQIQKNSNYLFKKRFVRQFPVSALTIISNKNFYLVASGNKSSFALFSKKTGKALYDSGIDAVMPNGSKLTSNWFNAGNKMQLDGNKLQIKGRLTSLAESVISPLKTIVMRMFQLTIGKNRLVSKIVKRKLREKLITAAKQSSVKFARTILIGEKKIVLEDWISQMPKQLAVGRKASYNYIPSARYFQKAELDSAAISKKNQNRVVRSFDSRLL